MSTNLSNLQDVSYGGGRIISGIAKQRDSGRCGSLGNDTFVSAISYSERVLGLRVATNETI
jgi:hypothetical protein